MVNNDSNVEVVLKGSFTQWVATMSTLWVGRTLFMG